MILGIHFQMAWTGEKMSKELVVRKTIFVPRYERIENFLARWCASHSTNYVISNR